MKELTRKILRKWMKLRLQPIRVFCFHQVSETFDPNVYCKPDWIPLDFLKGFVLRLQKEGYEFISLEEAHRHISEDFFRRKKYAVLTADDGLKCQVEIIPWLEEQNIPITLFVDLETLDGRTCTKPVKKYFNITNWEEENIHASKLFLTREQLLVLKYTMLSIGMHGLKHDSVQDMKEIDFAEQVEKCRRELVKLKLNVIPFFAYPYGYHSHDNDATLKNMGIVSVLASGNVNYNNPEVIHREIMEEIYKCQSHQS